MSESPAQDAWILQLTPEIHPPSLQDNTADTDRVIRALERLLNSPALDVDLETMKRLPELLRSAGYRVRASVFHDRNNWRLLDVAPAAAETPLYGLAVDLGSSTVVVQLLDLESGMAAAERSFHNPQITVAPDILSRIHHAAESGGLEELREMIVHRLNQEIRDLSRAMGLRREQLAGLSLAGNTTMTHLFMGLTPYWLCREPYIPVVNRPPILAAGELGIDIHPRAPVLVFPNVGSYFGGDLLAGILASGMAEAEETAFLVDVGTNAEVVIGNRDWLMACAGAAGPALEGGVASMGMMAGPGVIDAVDIDPESLAFRVGTIQGERPRGICGSGLIQLAAQLFLAGMIDLRGKFVPERCGDRLIEPDGIRHLVIVPEEESDTGRALTLSQPDLDALMRSKAAMYTILTTIASTVGLSLNDVERFYVAGTFGSYIDPRSAVTLGMIPDLPLKTYVPLGNTSLQGAALALVSRKDRDRIPDIRDRITYLELNVNQEFMNLFSAAKFIPHTDRSLFPSVWTAMGEAPGSAANSG